MCHVIQIENIISNYFAKNVAKNRVSLSALSIYKKEIETTFRERHKLVYINYNKSSLINAAQINSDIFSLEKGNIAYDINKREILNNRLETYFNAKLPYKIKDEYLEIFNEVNSKYEQNSK